MKRWGRIPCHLRLRRMAIGLQRFQSGSSLVWGDGMNSMRCFLVILVLGFLNTSFAEDMHRTPAAYRFQFKMQGETFRYELQETSFQQAFEIAAQACFRHFKGSRSVSENRGLDIIDVCANPSL